MAAIAEQILQYLNKQEVQSQIAYRKYILESMVADNLNFSLVEDMSYSQFVKSYNKNRD